jgi:hypothetical protein
MSDVHGKFSLTRSPEALPGHCGGCGRAKDNLGFIDTGLQFEYFGALIFCSECVLDMASKFGYINMETADSLKSRVSELEEETMRQRAAILGLEEALDGIQTARNNLNSANTSNLTPTPVSETPNVPPQEKEGHNGDSISETSTGGEPEGNSEINGPNSEQESSGVSSDSSHAELAELNF